ncbi:transcriptional regulator [Streptococcus pneumoniae]|nr:transcriptional regulator [Streptococcus pneumoniae]VKN10965.1 transcriptional regulator [Streptococcus pneumoniae]
MKLRIEIDGNLEETEIVIKTPTLTDEIADLQRLLQESKAPRLTFYKGTGEYYLDLSEILFFETEGSKIYAHNQKEAYEVRLKLYELESILPRYFNRVSKSTIANIRQILLSGQVLFRNGHHFLLSDAQGGSCLTALPIPPKRKSKKHEVKNMKKKAFGIVLLVLAAWILLQGNFGIPSLDGKIWPLLGIVFLLISPLSPSLDVISLRQFLQVYWRSSLQITLMTCYQLPIILLFGLASWWYLVLVI